MKQSGCEVPEYMLKLKQDPNKRKKLLKKAPRRDKISTILEKPEKYVFNFFLSLHAVRRSFPFLRNVQKYTFSCSQNEESECGFNSTHSTGVIFTIKFFML